MTLLTAAASVARRVPRFHGKVRAGRSAAWLAVRLGASPVGLHVLDDGSRLLLDARSRTESEAIWNGGYDDELVDLLVDLAGAFGGPVHDVGANVGLVGIRVARLVAADVEYFEPVPANCARLRDNVTRNGLDTSRVHEVALADTRAAARMRVERGAETGNAVLTGSMELGSGFATPLEVRTDRLDDFLAAAGMPPPSVVKLDIEGAEALYLRGGARTIAASRPVIVGEFNRNLMPNFGTTFLDAAAALPPDYATLAFAADGVLVEVPPEEGRGNVVLVPREKIGALPTQVRG